MKSLLKVLAILPFSLGIVTPGAFAADDYPSRPVTLVVPYPAGGTIDRLARDFAEFMRTRWSQPIVVMNRGGGDGVVGVDSVRRAAPDGYTLLIGGGSTHTVGPATDSEMKYDPIKDFSAIAYFGDTPMIFTAGPSMGTANFEQMIARAKSAPGKYTFGSVGNSTALVGNMLEKAAGIQTRSVNYKQFGATVLDIGRGDVDMGISSLSIVIGNVQQKMVRPLAVTSRERSKLLPDVPTVAEKYPGFEVGIWFGLWGPAGLPADMVTRLNREMAAFQQAPGRAEKWGNEGFVFRARSVPEFAAYVKSDLDRWRAVAADASMRKEK